MARRVSLPALTIVARDVVSSSSVVDVLIMYLCLELYWYYLTGDD